LEGHDGGDEDGLEEQGQGGLAARQAAVQQADAREDKPDYEGAEDQVDVVVFVAGVLGVYIDGAGIAAVGVKGVILGLDGVSREGGRVVT
jgi:hypothetical protein